MIIAWLIVSLIVGVKTLKKWEKEENYIRSFPKGDIGEYVNYSSSYKKITATHYVFPLSIVVIKAWLTICKIANSHRYD